MLASGKVWVGNLTKFRDALGHTIQGRQLTRRVIVSSWPQVFAQVVSLLDQKVENAAPFGEAGGSSLINGLLVRPFVAESGAPDDETQPIVIDLAGIDEELFIAYHPSQQDYDLGPSGSRRYIIIGGKICYGD
ncbi:MAG: hypothetical protein AAB728_01160 [Patescibacteria group bacterium]